MHDFYFTGDDYRYRFEAGAKQRFIDVLREGFNSGVGYKGCVMKWDTVIQEKTAELARYLAGRSRRGDFAEPAPLLERIDNRTIRQMILSLTQSEARRRRIGKSTLHHLRKKAHDDSSFSIYRKVQQRLAAGVS